MLVVVLSNALALILEAVMFASHADTTDVYFVDGKRIEYFDGSQVSNAMIQSYKIERVPGLAQRRHVINTYGADKAYFIPNLSEMGHMTIINGKVIGLNGKQGSLIDGYDPSSDNFEILPPGSIIMGEKKGDIKYEKSDVVVKTASNKATVFSFENAVYLVNGRKITKNEFDKIDLTTIISVSIIKDPAEVKKYDIGNIKTVISIATK